MVSGLMFKAVIHFEFLLYMVKEIGLVSFFCI